MTTAIAVPTRQPPAEPVAITPSVSAAASFALGDLVTLATLPHPRFVAIDDDGLAVEAGSPNHRFTRDRWAGVDWPLVDDSEKSLNHEHAEVLIHKRRMRRPGGTWRLPTIDELSAIIDRTRSRPAVDPLLFPGFQSDWYWSGSRLAAYPDVAWFVYFYHGLVLNALRGSGARVRAVRVASLPASQ